MSGSRIACKPEFVLHQSYIYFQRHLLTAELSCTQLYSTNISLFKCALSSLCTLLLEWIDIINACCAGGL